MSQICKVDIVSVNQIFKNRELISSLQFFCCQQRNFFINAEKSFIGLENVFFSLFSVKFLHFYKEKSFKDWLLAVAGLNCWIAQSRLQSSLVDWIVIDNPFSKLYF
jgi:hypothetical protein